MIKKTVLWLIPVLLLAGCGSSHASSKAAAAKLDSPARAFCQDVEGAYLRDQEHATTFQLANQKLHRDEAATAGRKSSNVTIRGLAVALDNPQLSLGQVNTAAKADFLACQAQGFTG